MAEELRNPADAVQSNSEYEMVRLLSEGSRGEERQKHLRYIQDLKYVDNDKVQQD